MDSKLFQSAAIYITFKLCCINSVNCLHGFPKNWCHTTFYALSLVKFVFFREYNYVLEIALTRSIFQIPSAGDLHGSARNRSSDPLAELRESTSKGREWTRSERGGERTPSYGSYTPLDMNVCIQSAWFRVERSKVKVRVRVRTNSNTAYGFALYNEYLNSSLMYFSVVFCVPSRNHAVWYTFHMRLLPPCGSYSHLPHLAVGS